MKSYSIYLPSTIRIYEKCYTNVGYLLTFKESGGKCSTFRFIERLESIEVGAEVLLVTKTDYCRSVPRRQLKHILHRTANEKLVISRRHRRGLTPPRTLFRIFCESLTFKPCRNVPPNANNYSIRSCKRTTGCA